jgi:dTDP-glucose 4,6-dehydratase
MRWLITGGCGFMGSNFIRYWLNHHPEDSILNLDKLTYAGNPDNLKDIEKNPHYSFIQGDIVNPEAINPHLAAIDGIINFAAETHVDRSISQPRDFIMTDMLGTYNLLEAARFHQKKMIQISTDEVYGNCPEGRNDEKASLTPGNPYSASKGGADLLCLAYRQTYGIDIIITRSCNCYGPYQYPEKLIPLFITNLMEGQKVPLYGDGSCIREWIYIQDYCTALETAIMKGKSGEIYNISTGKGISNLEVTKMILREMELGEEWIEKVADRQGHDTRYALDATKLMELGWLPQYSFPHGLNETIHWYRENKPWWKKIKSGEFLEYYKRQYGHCLKHSEGE